MSLMNTQSLYGPSGTSTQPLPPSSYTINSLTISLLNSVAIPIYITTPFLLVFSNNAALKYHKLDTCLPNNIKLHSWLRSLDKKCEFIFLPEFNSNEKKQFKVEKTYIPRSLVLGSNSKLSIPASLKNVEQKDGFFLLSFIPVDTAIFNTNNLPTNSLNSLSSSRYHNEFEEVEKLGRGGFGIVWRCRNKLDGQYYAIKKVHVNLSSKNNDSPTKKWSKIIREVQTFAQISTHPNVVRYYNAWIEPTDLADNIGKKIGNSSKSTCSSFSSDDDTPSALLKEEVKEMKKHTIHIQMQLCPSSDLRRWIGERKVVDGNSNLEILWQLLSGIAHIHSQNIIHRDLKPDNIFIDGSHVLIGDFGLAKSQQSTKQLRNSNLTNRDMFSTKSRASSSSSSFQQLSNYKGTFLYTAPELFGINGDKCTIKSDIYSLGVIMIELYALFKTGMERALVLKDLKCSEDGLGRVKQAMKDYPLVYKVTLQCLDSDPLKRPSAMDLLDGELFQDFLLSPNTSPSLHQHSFYASNPVALPSTCPAAFFQDENGRNGPGIGEIQQSPKDLQNGKNVKGLLVHEYNRDPDEIAGRSFSGSSFYNPGLMFMRRRSSNAPETHNPFIQNGDISDEEGDFFDDKSGEVDLDGEITFAFDDDSLASKPPSLTPLTTPLNILLQPEFTKKIALTRKTSNLASSIKSQKNSNGTEEDLKRGYQKEFERQVEKLKQEYERKLAKGIRSLKESNGISAIAMARVSSSNSNSSSASLPIAIPTNNR